MRSFWIFSLVSPVTTTAFHSGINSYTSAFQRNRLLSSSSSSTAIYASGSPPNKAPSFNGKVVYPSKVFVLGLKGHKVAATYALMDNRYKRGQEGWDTCQYVGITDDLHSSLTLHMSKSGPATVANVRAVSFKNADQNLVEMDKLANEWKDLVQEAGGDYLAIPALPSELEFQGLKSSILIGDQENDQDDDDDDDDIDLIDLEEQGMDIDFAALARDKLSNVENLQVTDPSVPASVTTTATANVVSPFEQASSTTSTTSTITTTNPLDELEFSKESVDKVLEEVRPYLIQDGGNVSVLRVDTVNQDVYLKLEGACGSCASSTVTMEMGIQRILLENFPNLGRIVQVEDEIEALDPQDQVMEEVRRILPAITAMGANVEIVNINDLGVVEVRFRGASRVQKGLELALLDVPSVKHVKFLGS